MKIPMSNYSGPVVVDPLTRIEGHLRIEVEVENGKVKDARSCGTLFRGLELILKGRDPRDVQHFTQRTCGVCTYTHALASTRALEDADAALKYLLDREDLRIDPELIFAAGTSAGAITALNLAFWPAGDRPRIRAVGNFWGSVHDLGVLENARTAILSFQSVHDPVMPYGEGYPFRTGDRRFQPPVQWFSEEMFGTEAVYERAKELGLRVEHHPCEEPRHRLHIGDDGEYTDRFYEIRDRMADFFAEEISARLSGQGRR